MGTFFEVLKKAEIQNQEHPVSDNRKKLPLLIIVALILLVGITGFQMIKKFSRAGSKIAFNRPAAVKTFSVEMPAVKPEVKKKRPAGVYELEGVIYNADAPLAVINGRLLKVGETTGDMTLEEIAPAAVVLLNTKTDRRMELKLK